MPKKQKVVHCKITFDEDGNVTDVEGNGNTVTGKLLKDYPIDGVVGIATIMVKVGEDPCVQQGTKLWCW